MPPIAALLALTLALHVYVAARIAPDLPGAVAGLAFALAVAAMAGLVPLGLASRRAARSRPRLLLAWLGLLAMGLFSSLLVGTVLRDLLLILGWAAAWIWPGVDPAGWLQPSAMAVVGLAGVASALGLWNAVRTPAVVCREIPLAGLPPALHGMRIVQISDVHVGPTIGRRYLGRVVEAVNALGADIVAITGDLVDGRVADLADQVAPLARLQARHGSFFVTGNHEYYSGVRPWLAELERLGVRVLLNQHVVLQQDDARLVLAGVTDYSAHHFDAAHASDARAALAGAPTDAPRILLAHQPRSATAAEQAGADVQLSGHTHGGQIWPWKLLVPLQQPYTAGLHRLGRMWVYVSRGTGYWGPPKRLGAPSEITLIRLVAATSD